MRTQHDDLSESQKPNLSPHQEKISPLLQIQFLWDCHEQG